MYLTLMKYYFPLPLPSRQSLRNLDDTLNGLCFSGRLLEAVDLLCRKGSSVEPQTYAFLLQEAINRKEVKLGKRIHAHMITTGFVPHDYLRTKLVIFYGKNGYLDTAHQLFDGIPSRRDLVSWNAMISGYVQNGLEQEGLNLYYSMRSGGLEPDQFTFASVFRACARLAILEHGKRVHCVMIKTQTKKANVVVNSALVDMYVKYSSLDDGYQVFKSLSERNVVTWTALISGYGQHGRVVEVLELFHQMIEDGFRPNHITLLAVLSACSHGGLVEEGWKYFSSMRRDYGIRPRGEHYAAIVDMLGRAGRLDEAYEFVRKSPCEEHSVIWGALLGASRIHGDVLLGKLAAKRFFELQPEIEINHISVLFQDTPVYLSLHKPKPQLIPGMKTMMIAKQRYTGDSINLECFRAKDLAQKKGLPCCWSWWDQPLFSDNTKQWKQCSFHANYDRGYQILLRRYLKNCI